MNPIVFLGKAFGFQLVNDHSQIKEFYEKALKILPSVLTPWQKLDSLKSFFFPALLYAQRTHRIPKSDWRELDDALRSIIKKDVLNLPERAATEYLYGSSADCLLGLPLAAEDSDIALIDGAFKALTPTDEVVMEAAWQDLCSSASYRFRSAYRAAGSTPPPLTYDHLSAFLSGDRILGSNRGMSLFTQARQASSRLGVRWNFNNDKTISITRRGITTHDRSKIFHAVRDNFRKSRSYALKCKPDQGKTQPCFERTKVSAHYPRPGDFIRFCDWRFIHPARLNLLPLNGAKTENKDKPDLQRCRKFNYKFEGLPYVLCNCKKNLVKITERHNMIIKRLKVCSARSWSVLKENQPLEGSSLRPDLELVHKSESAAMILDVGCTFENGPAAYDMVRTEKSKKYAQIAKSMKDKYKEVTVEAIVVGALGSWDPKNDRVCHRLCSKKYRKLMRKLIVSDTLRMSRDIYVSHVTPH